MEEITVVIIILGVVAVIAVVGYVSSIFFNVCSIGLIILHNIGISAYARPTAAPSTGNHGSAAAAAATELELDE